MSKDAMLSVSMSTKGHPRYLEEYPRFVTTVSQLVDRISEADFAVSLLVLFGSVARLTPDTASDADVLVLFEGVGDHMRLMSLTMEFIHQARAIEEQLIDAHYRWPIVPIPGMATGDDLDPDFLEGIAADAVLLYHRAGSPVPPQLARSTPYGVWLERLGALLAAHGIALSPPRVAP